MTYNFDPARWYDDERQRIELRRQAGTLSEADAATAFEQLDARYEAMVARLDGTFELGPTRKEGTAPRRDGTANPTPGR